MQEEKMHLINKIFNNETIRTVWDKDLEKYYISVVDIVGVVSESTDGRKYWNKLKQRLKEEGNESVKKCHQLKLKAQDGKYRLTDVVDIEGMFRIIESIPSKNAWCLDGEKAEESTKRLATKKRPQGLEENIEIARIGGNVAKVAKENLEENLGENIVTSSNRLNYEYKKELVGE